MTQLALKARTEVTGFSILSQSVKTLMRLVSARTLDDLKKVSPDDSALDNSLSGLPLSSFLFQRHAWPARSTSSKFSRGQGGRR
jgi:hypothetical protein